MERTETHPAGALALQGGVFAHQRHDVSGCPDLGYIFVRDPHVLTVPRGCNVRLSD